MRAEVEANNKAVNSTIDATKEYLGPYFENTCKHFTLRLIKYYETTRQNRKSRLILAGFQLFISFLAGGSLCERSLGSCRRDHLAVAGTECLTFCNSDRLAEEFLRSLDGFRVDKLAHKGGD